MLFHAFTTLVLSAANGVQDSVAIRVSFASSPDRPPLEWIMTDSANVPVESGKTPTEFARKVRDQLFTVCGTRVGEQLAVHIQISQTMALDASAECVRFGHENGKVILRWVRRSASLLERL